MRETKQGDLALTEVSKISFDHQRSRKRKKTNVTEAGMAEKETVVDEQSSGCYSVANRTLINKVLYTNEDVSSHGSHTRTSSTATKRNNGDIVFPI